MIKGDDERRFLSFVEKNGPMCELLGTKCWEWTGFAQPAHRGASDPSQWYGRWHQGGKNGQYVHRWSHEHFNGPVPEGFQVDHLCSRPICVNPDHLQATTKAVNILRGITNPTAINKRKTHCPQGHEYNEINTRISPKGWRYCRPCNRAAHKKMEAKRRGAVQ